MTALISDVDLAGEFGVTVEKLHELRKRYRWPCVKLGRFEVRFTNEQVQQIVALHSETPSKVESNVVSIPGQTARSAARGRR